MGAPGGTSSPTPIAPGGEPRPVGGNLPGRLCQWRHPQKYRGDRGSAFADTLIGNAGDNVLRGGKGGQILDGGDNGPVGDTADYSTSSAGVTVILGGTSSGGDADGDTLVDIENVTGSAKDDVLIGDGGANLLDGGAGNDVLQGGGGDDTLKGGSGLERPAMKGRPAR